MANETQTVTDGIETVPSAQVNAALIKAQQQMDSLIKDSENPHFRSSYASLTAVLGVIIDPLLDNGLIIKQAVYMQDETPVLRTTLIHESGETIDGGDYPLFVVDQTNPQKLGSAVTYARRYSLMAFFGLAPEDDDGNEASPPPSTSKAQSGGGGSRGLSTKQKDYITSLLKQAGYTTKTASEKRTKEIARKSMADLTGKDATTVINALKEEIGTETKNDPHNAPY